ncbi:DgyrCDS13254 [Dimorphilus gyrociliatus]|uniref:DgyrCDS13254 n=1 Tax=Dimorphilus gyrociliatus TaxID=2664684 RepID=A0A7I8WA54_9ANNE|nr:DgyrCDS13254 [Dimorphilus gyrociliatus]
MDIRLVCFYGKVFCEVLSGSLEKAILDVHNKLRRQEGAADMKIMSWNGPLANQASKWAEKCHFEHGFDKTEGVDGSAGQNLFISGGSGQYTDMEAVVKAWYNEKKDYNYNKLSCSKVCGHYTQVVWADTNRLGCGYKYCSKLTEDNGKVKNNVHYIVCNYSPPGNFKGQKPFKKGDACSLCSSGSGWCRDGLCDSCSSASGDCTCPLKCKNCGTLNSSNCKCKCSTGWTGGDCSEDCKDNHSKCGKSPGYPKSVCKNPTIIDFMKSNYGGQKICNDASEMKIGKIVIILSILLAYI